METFKSSFKKIKYTFYVLSLSFLVGCEPPEPPGPSESEISQCVRYNTDRFEEREFERRWEVERGFHEACNNLERALGGTGCKDPKPRLRDEAREEARGMSSFLKNQCSKDISYVY
jgi:hypothetical protein